MGTVRTDEFSKDAVRIALGNPQNLNRNRHQLTLTGHSILATASYMTSAGARTLACGCALMTQPSK